jgi:signal transduction histidine kinase
MTLNYDEIPINIVIKKVLEAEVYSLFLNILSNSIKSVIAAGENKRIKISAKRESGETVIKILDSGIGLDQSRFEEVFIPFISDPDSKLYNNLRKRIDQEDQLIVGSGSGLGLGIVKEIVEAHDGTVEFVKPPKNWSASLEIRLP